MPAVKANLRALPHGEVRAALTAVERSASSESAKACLRFVVLTAVRNGEARGATWAEIDIAAAVWTIPAERTKTGRELASRYPTPRSPHSTEHARFRTGRV